MRYLILIGVVVVFAVVIVWNVKRAAKGESNCGCEDGCSGSCCGKNE